MNILDILNSCCSLSKNSLLNEYSIEEYSDTCSVSSITTKITLPNINQSSIQNPIKKKLVQLYFHVWIGATKFLKQNVYAGNIVVWESMGYFFLKKDTRKCTYLPAYNIAKENINLIEDDYNVKLLPDNINEKKVFLNPFSIAKICFTDPFTVEVILKDIFEKIVSIMYSIVVFCKRKYKASNQFKRGLS